MAEDDEEDEEDEEDDEDGEGESKKGGKKGILIIGLVLLLVVGGAAAAFFTGMLDPLLAMISGDETEQVEGGPAADAVFYEVPEILVNLNTGARKSTFLKIRVSLEVEKQSDIERIERMMPRIIDNFRRGGKKSIPHESRLDYNCACLLYATDGPENCLIAGPISGTNVGA